MQLKDWMKKNRYNIKQFAELLDYNRDTIGKIINGKMTPTERFKKLVYKETNGEVSIDDWPDIKLVKKDDPNQLLLFDTQEAM
jgi:transcriptional regulator with XRE-family HTH domain